MEAKINRGDGVGDEDSKWIVPGMDRDLEIQVRLVTMHFQRGEGMSNLRHTSLLLRPRPSTRLQFTGNNQISPSAIYKP